MNLFLRLLRKIKAFAEGPPYFEKAPSIKGKTDYGKKPSLTFFFDTEEECDYVYSVFKDGRSRIPSGKKLLEFVKKHGPKPPEQVKLE